MRLPSTLLLFSAGLAALPAAAQGPTITQADMPVTGDTLRLSRGVGLGIDFQTTGPNQTWDFSTLTPVSQRVAEFLDPLAGAGPLILFTFGPLGGANRASVATPTQLPIDSLPGAGGLNFGDLRGYFRRQAADYRQVGFSAAVNGLAVPVTFASGQQDIVYRLPLSFASAADSSDSYFEANVPGTAFLSQQQRRVNEPDGWGSLTTPFGTFATVRVRTRLDAFDSLAISGQMPIALQLPTRYEYKWLAVGQHVPLLTINTALIGGNETVTGVEYRDIYRRIVLGTPADVAALREFTVAPNPVGAGQAVALRGLPTTGPVRLDVSDALGRRLLTRTIHGTQATLTAADLGTARGVLTVRLTTADGTVVRRVVRE